MINQPVKSFINFRLSEGRRSQPVAPRAKPGKVQVVVANSFDDIVMDESKNVFIEFFAPWCGHCQRLKPAYDKLAEVLKDKKDIIIAKFDATANEIPATFKVEGYPTMYLALPGKKDEPIEYGNRERDVETMKAFVMDNSVVMSKDVQVGNSVAMLKSGKDEL